MRDLTLDFDNKTIYNNYITGRNLIIQKVKLAIQCWAEDWFLDSDYGIPYGTRLQNKSLLIADIEEAIMSVEGVTSVQDTTVEIVYGNFNKKSQRQYKIYTTIITDTYEEIELNGLIPMIGV